MADTRLKNRVRQHRKAEALSQQKLAERIGVSRQAIHAIETGSQVPSTSLGLRMARVFGCDVEDIFSLASDPGIRAHLAPAPPGHAAGSRVALGRVGDHWVAHRLPAHGMTSADGILTSEGDGTDAEVTPLSGVGQLKRNVQVAGCAPLLGAVSHRVGRRFNDARVTWLRAGSGRAMKLLSAGLVHVAGLHLSAGGGETTPPPWPPRFAGRGCRGQPDRAPGLGCPQAIPGDRGTAAIWGARLRVAARERDPGPALTPRTMEAAGCGLPDGGPVAEGHAEVARLIRWGAADVGVAIESAALAEGLDFVPLTEERFDLVVPAAFAEEAPVSRLIDALDDPAFRTEVSHLPGYDGSMGGRSRPVEGRREDPGPPGRAAARRGRCRLCASQAARRCGFCCARPPRGCGAPGPIDRRCASSPPRR